MPESTTLQCAYFDSGACRSCALLATPYEQQLAQKDARVHALVPAAEWLPPVASALSHFRTKAKMVVGGTVDEPTLGILNLEQHGVDLSSCPIVDERILAALPAIKDFVVRAQLVPYDVPRRSGELKHVLITVAPAGELMVRFVLRSTESLSRIRKHLAWLQSALPQLRVVTVNLLPAHAALTEGDDEIVLGEADSLAIQLDGHQLHLLPHSFFQTNTAMAEALYRQGASWIDEVDPRTLWDLYCGIGGFALYSARTDRRVIGVEMSEAAVTSARRSAADVGVPADFVAADAGAWVRDQAEPPDLVIVNPPRRGIGRALAAWLDDSGVGHVLYSSCNAESLAADLAAMPSLRPVKARVFDMFAHTAHFETLVLLERG